MFEAGLPVATVFADRPCAALALAAEHGTTAELVDRRPTAGSAPASTGKVQRHGQRPLVAYQVDLVAMAGFGTVMTEAVHAPSGAGSSTRIRPCSRRSRVGTGCTTRWRPGWPDGVHGAPGDARDGRRADPRPKGRGGAPRRHRGDAARADQGRRAARCTPRRWPGPWASWRRDAGIEAPQKGRAGAEAKVVNKRKRKRHETRR